MIPSEEVARALRIGTLPEEELLGILSGVFPLSRWEGERRVSYFHPEQGHVLDVVYSGRGRIASFEARAGLTADLLDTLRERAESAFVEEAGSEVRRDILFSFLEVKGYWRYQDDWQILPAPPGAPRPEAVLAEHPFVLEYRVRSSANDTIGLTRRIRRLWELQLLLSLLLRGSITRESFAHEHHWVMLREPTPEGHHTAYLNEGYMVGGGFVVRAPDLSNPEGFEPLRVVSDDECYSRRGIRVDDEMQVPASLELFFERFDAADPDRRDKLLRASYWFDTAYRVWHMSKSLSYISAINAIESLSSGERGGHTCPVCDRFHDSPGPTARFRSFVETYAATELAEARNAIYNLRSTFVHGAALHGLDIPGAWGALEPAVEEQRSLHDAALAVARTAIRTWFLQAGAI